jgi:hypothetical protein
MSRVMGRQPTARLPDSNPPCSRSALTRSRVMAPMLPTDVSSSLRVPSSCSLQSSHLAPEISSASSSSNKSGSPSVFTQTRFKSNVSGNRPDNERENENTEAEESEDEGHEIQVEEEGEEQEEDEQEGQEEEEQEEGEERPPERTGDGDGALGRVGPSICLHQSAVLYRVMEDRRERLGTRNDPLRCRPTRIPGYDCQLRGGGGAQIRVQRQSRSSRVIADESDDDEMSGGADAELSDYAPVDETEEEEEDEEEETPTLLWAKYLRTLRSRDPDFFSSAEARMETEATQGSKAAAGLMQGGVENARRAGVFDGCRSRSTQYKGLETSKENCPDLRYAYEQEYEIQIRRGGKLDGYRQF